MSTSEMLATDLLSTALNIDPSEVGPETSLADTSAWDSLAHMRLIAAIETSTGVEVPVEDIIGIIDFSSVVNALKKHS